jgi:hypothetical protein
MLDQSPTTFERAEKEAGLNQMEAIEIAAPRSHLKLHVAQACAQTTANFPWSTSQEVSGSSNTHNTKLDY